MSAFACELLPTRRVVWRPGATFRRMECRPPACERSAPGQGVIRRRRPGRTTPVLPSSRIARSRRRLPATREGMHRSHGPIAAPCTNLPARGSDGAENIRHLQRRHRQRAHGQLVDRHRSVTTGTSRARPAWPGRWLRRRSRLHSSRSSPRDDRARTTSKTAAALGLASPGEPPGADGAAWTR